MSIKTRGAVKFLFPFSLNSVLVLKFMPWIHESSLENWLASLPHAKVLIEAWRREYNDAVRNAVADGRTLIAAVHLVWR
ncbi:transposase [Burkholderia plantarii]|uniref:transposase n=1 Tax=Burkholderia plantarii TaxID=41899 RepID=UPI0011DF0E96|nr:transposase [Burkholderia plantarii]